MKSILMLGLWLGSCGAINVVSMCDYSITRFYGMQGIEDVIDYSDIRKAASKDFCPFMLNSCCSVQDFEKTKELWQDKAREIREYATNVFSVFQKIAVTHAALGDMIGRIPAALKQKAFCRDLDPLFFSKTLKFSEIYLSLKSALEAFAFVQKGFYCSICDGDAHRFMQTGEEGRKSVLTLSRNSCANLLFYFKDYVAYKMFYFDPLVINLNFLSNCLNRDTRKSFKPTYNNYYRSLKNCVIHNQNCDTLCKEFRLGGSFPLFIGDLQQYSEVLDTMEELLEKFGNGAQADSIGKVQITSGKFFDWNDDSDYTPDPMADLSTFEIQISEIGLDIFTIAENSAYDINPQIEVKDLSIDDGSEIRIDRTSIVNMKDLQSENLLPTSSEVSLLNNMAEDLNIQAINNLSVGKLETVSVDTETLGAGGSSIKWVGALSTSLIAAIVFIL